MPAALVTRRPALTGCLTMYPGLPLNRVPLSRVPFCHTHTQAHSVTMYPGYPLNCVTLSSVPFCHTHTNSDNVPGIVTEPCPIVTCTILSHTQTNSVPMYPGFPRNCVTLSSVPFCHTHTDSDYVPGIAAELHHCDFYHSDTVCHLWELKAFFSPINQSINQSINQLP